MVMEDMEATMEVMAVTAMASALLMGLLGAAMKRDLPWPTLATDMVMEDMVVTTEDMGTMVMARGMPMPHLTGVRHRQFDSEHFIFHIEKS